MITAMTGSEAQLTISHIQLPWIIGHGKLNAVVGYPQLDYKDIERLILSGGCCGGIGVPGPWPTIPRTPFEQSTTPTANTITRRTIFIDSSKFGRLAGFLYEIVGIDALHEKFVRK